jgi:hypothetical protein
MSMFALFLFLFTYYGVNFHLVGLHSYASGEAPFGFGIHIGIFQEQKQMVSYRAHGQNLEWWNSTPLQNKLFAAM